MANVLRNAVANLATSLMSLGGATVTYVRGNDSVELVAIPGTTKHYDASLEIGVQLTGRERDWIIPATDLAIGGENIKPKRGDLINWVDEYGDTRTFQVLPRLGDRCYRYTDQTMTLLRVYTIESIASAE